MMATCPGGRDARRWQQWSTTTIRPACVFPVFGAMRLLRFGLEAWLALVYGRGILRTLESDAFQIAIGVFIAVAVLGTAASGARLWHSTRESRAGGMIARTRARNRPSLPAPPSRVTACGCIRAGSGTG